MKGKRDMKWAGLIVAACFAAAPLSAMAKDDSRSALIVTLDRIADARLEARAAEVAKIATPAVADARKAWVFDWVADRVHRNTRDLLEIAAGRTGDPLPELLAVRRGELR